jgi:hypothetical protein
LLSERGRQECHAAVGPPPPANAEGTLDRIHVGHVERAIWSCPASMISRDENPEPVGLTGLFVRLIRDTLMGLPPNAGRDACAGGG